MVAIRYLDLQPDDLVVVVPQRHLRVVPRAAAGDRMAGVYRRRRLVAAAVGAGLAFGLLQVAGPVLGDPAVEPLRAGEVHVVRPGDTYWSIAAALDTDGDIRRTVDRLATANGERPLQVGDRLELPA